LNLLTIKNKKMHILTKENSFQDFRKYAKDKFNTPGTTIDSVVKASLTPYILEEREVRANLMDVFSRMMMERIIWMMGEVEDNNCTVIQAQMMYLESTGKDDITLHINSPGGSILAGMSVIDCSRYIKSDLITVNMGMCASMGAVLLASGTPGKRKSLKHSRTMIHAASSGFRGNYHDFLVEKEEFEYYQNLVMEMLAQFTGKKKEEVEKSCERDKWFSAEASKEFGLIDSVIEWKK
jgi:ATP-dependent Clp protease protease subunit